MANLVVGNLERRFPYSNPIFDAVVCVDVLHAITDKNRTLAECRRVLKPGGTLIATHPEDRISVLGLIGAQLKFSRRSRAESHGPRLVSLVTPLGSSGLRR